MTSFQEIILRILEEKCYELHNVTNAANVTDKDEMCEAVFDGLYCWPFTKAGVLALQPCSNNILKSTNQVSAISTYNVFFILVL